MSASKHKHDFKHISKPVLLARYEPDEGNMTYMATTGKDVLKQRKCKCGLLETYDLERVKA